MLPLEGFVIFQCDGGGNEESSSEEETSETSVESEEDEGDEEEDGEEEEDAQEETSEESSESSDSNDNDEEVEEKQEVKTRPTTRGKPSSSTSQEVSRGRITRQKLREEMPQKRYLRSRKKSPVAGGWPKKPQIFPCPKCKKEFNSKGSVNRHGRWCKPKKSSPTKAVKNEESSKKDQDDKNKKVEETPSSSELRRGRGRPRKNPLQKPPTPSTSKQIAHEEKAAEMPVVPENNFMNQRSPDSSPGQIMDTSSESDYEQREYAANAHHLQYRSANVSVDVDTTDDPTPSVLENSDVEMEMFSGPVTCPQCKMTYRTAQGYQNHVAACVAYSSEEEENEDEEVEVVDDPAAERQMPHSSQTSHPVQISQQPSTQILKSPHKIRSKQVAEAKSEDESSSSESSEQNMQIDSNDHPEPAVLVQPNSAQRPVITTNDNKQTSGKEICNGIPPGNFQPIQSIRMIGMEKLNVSNSQLVVTTVKSAVSPQRPTIRPPLQQQYLKLRHQLQVPSFRNQISSPEVPRSLEQVPVQFNQVSPCSVSQFSNGGGVVSSPAASQQPQHSSTSVPILHHTHHGSGNPPTYTQAQLMPGTVLHNSAMNLQQQMSTSAEPYPVVSSQQHHAAVMPLHFSSGQPSTYGSLSQDHMLRVSNVNGGPLTITSGSQSGMSFNNTGNQSEIAQLFTRNGLVNQPGHNHHHQQQQSATEITSQHQQLQFQHQPQPQPHSGLISVPGQFQGGQVQIPFGNVNTDNMSQYVVGNGNLPMQQANHQNAPIHPHHQIPVPQQLPLPTSNDHRSQTQTVTAVPIQNREQQQMAAAQSHQVHLNGQQSIIGLHTNVINPAGAEPHLQVLQQQQQQQQLHLQQYQFVPGQTPTPSVPKLNEKLSGSQPPALANFNGQEISRPQHPLVPYQIQPQQNSQIPQILLQQQFQPQQPINQSSPAPVAPLQQFSNLAFNVHPSNVQPPQNHSSPIVPGNVATNNPSTDLGFQGAAATGVSPQQHHSNLHQQFYEIQQQHLAQNIQDVQQRLPQQQQLPQNVSYQWGKPAQVVQQPQLPQLQQPQIVQHQQQLPVAPTSSATVPVPTAQIQQQQVPPPQPQAQQINVAAQPQQPQQQQLTQMIQQIAQFTDGSGNTYIILTPPSAPVQQSPTLAQNGVVNQGNNVSGNLGLLNLIPGAQAVQCQQQQSPTPQVVHCSFNAGTNGFVSHAPATQTTGKSAPCPCPTCKEKTITATAMEKYKKVLPYPSSSTGDHPKSSPAASATVNRPISIRPATLKQTKTVKHLAVLQPAPSPQQSLSTAGVRVVPLTLGVKPGIMSAIPSSVGMGVLVDNGVATLTAPHTARSLAAPNTNIAVVRPMENPLQKMSDQISQIESIFHQTPQPQPMQLQQLHPQQQQQSSVPAAVASRSQLTHVLTASPSPPLTHFSPTPISAPQSPVVNLIEHIPLTPTSVQLAEIDKQIPMPRLTLVDHGTPRPYPQNTAATGIPTTPTPTQTPTSQCGVKRKAPPSSSGTKCSPSIKFTLTRKQNDDSYSFLQKEQSDIQNLPSKSIAITGKIKSGKLKGKESKVVVQPCIRLEPIRVPETSDAEEGNVNSPSKGPVSVPQANKGGPEVKVTHCAKIEYAVETEGKLVLRSANVLAVSGFIFKTIQGIQPTEESESNLPPLTFPPTNVSLSPGGNFSKERLIHAAVKFLLQHISNPDSSRYVRPTPSVLPKSAAPEKEEDDDEETLVQNDSGCARSEVFAGRNEFDMFGWLASKHRKPPVPNNAPMENAKVIGMPITMRFRKLKEKVKHLVVWCSTIHGRGLYTKRDIEKGEMIIEYAGEVIRPMVCDRREKYYESKSIGCYMFRVNDHVIDATMRGNAARFINHSCEPNCEAKAIRISGKDHILIFALRSIGRGEELTYDYKFEKEEEKIPCTCGSKHCRKYLN